MKKTICKFLAAAMAVTLAVPCVSFADDSAAINVIEFENFEGNFSPRTVSSNSGRLSTAGWVQSLYTGFEGAESPVVSGNEDNKSLYLNSGTRTDAATQNYSMMIGNHFEEDGVLAPYADNTGATKVAMSFDVTFAQMDNGQGIRIAPVGTKSGGSNAEVTTYYSLLNSSKTYLTDGANMSGSNWKKQINLNQKYNITFIVDLTTDEIHYYLNGAEQADALKTISGLDSIVGLNIYAYQKTQLNIDNYKAYIIPATGYQLTATQDDNNTDMPISSTFDMTFNGFVDENALSDITVTAGQTALSADEYTITSVQSVVNETGAQTSVSIKPAEAWEYKTDYVVAIPATVTDEAGTAATAASFTYTTEENPAGETPEEDEPIVIDGVSVVEFENFESDFSANSRASDAQQKTNTACDGWWYRVFAGYTDTVLPTVTEDADGNSYIYMDGGTKESGDYNFGVGFGKNLVGTGEEEGSVVLAPYSDNSGATKLVFSFDAEFLELGAAYGFRMTPLATTTQNGTQKTGQNPNYWCARYAENGTYFGNNSTHNNSTWRPAATLNQVYKIAIVADLSTETLHFYMNGVEDTTATKVFTDRTLDAIEGFWFYAGTDTQVKIDNFKAYIIPSGGYELEAVQGDNDMDMPLTSTFDMTFNGFVNEDALSEITVTAGQTALSADEYTITSVQSVVNGTGAQTLVSIAPAEAWNYGTDYVVTIPATVKDETGTEAVADSFTYTTQGAPSFATEISASTGFAGTGEEITALSDVAGKSINVSFTATNTTGGENAPRATSGMCFIGLYDADGNIIKYGSVNKDYAENQSKSMSFSIAIPADAADLQVKAFVCKDIFDLTPLSDVSIIPWTAE